jgi:hypothetical protein
MNKCGGHQHLFSQYIVVEKKWPEPLARCESIAGSLQIQAPLASHLFTLSFLTFGYL